MEKQHFEQQQVTYTLQIDDRFIVVENVPARVCVETGERFFSPEVVERLQQIAWEKRDPDRFIETPVFRYAS